MLGHVGMREPYRQLTSQERDLLAMMLAKGCTKADIARRLGRHRSTISREICRNGPRIRKKDYLSNKAQNRSNLRRKSSRRVGRLRDERVLDYVKAKIKQKWSPEIISGRIRKEKPGLSVSHETIYRWIYEDGMEYIGCLERRHRKRRKKGEGKKRHKCNIPQRIGIGDRPEIVNRRGEAGHWETDTAFFEHCDSVLHVMVERKSRVAKLTKLKDITAEETRNAMIRRHKHTPKHLRKSFTYDNGRENVCHVMVNNELGTKSYFCNPGHSWEKGTVENTIHLIRRFFPKKTNFEEVTEHEVKKVENWLNDRPRKCLNFMTPREAVKLDCCTYC